MLTTYILVEDANGRVGVDPTAILPIYAFSQDSFQDQKRLETQRGHGEYFRDLSFQVE